MIKRILKIIISVFILIIIFSLYMANRMDVFKTLTAKTPDLCSVLPMDGSAEDIKIDYERGIAYLSLEDRAALIKGEDVQGTIVKINLNETPYELQPALSQQPDHLRPHGISLYIDKNGQRHLGVINHPKNRESGDETVELFSEGRSGLFDYQQTVIDNAFKSPNALVLVAQDKFYLGNDKGAQTMFGKIQEQLGRPMSKIAYFNGNTVVIAAKNLSQVSGINVSNNQEYLFASETTAQRIAIFSIDSGNGELNKLETIKISGSPDNINITDKGDIVVAAIPKVIALIQHFISFQSEKVIPAPSQVLRFNWEFESLGSKPKIDELFLSEGNDFSTASVGTIWKNRLFMGSIDDKKLLICDL